MRRSVSARHLFRSERPPPVTVVFQLVYNWSMQTPTYYPKAEFIETVSVTGFEGGKDVTYVGTVKDTGNKVSRRATISGPQNIILGGKTIISNGAIIRGDLKRAGPGHAVVISLGRYCLVGEGCVMRYDSSPPPCSPEAISPHLISSWPVQASLQDLSWRI